MTRLLSGLAVLSSLTSIQVLASQAATKQDPVPPCEWHPPLLQNVCLNSASSPEQSTTKPSPFSKTRSEWAKLGWDGPNDCLPTMPDYCVYARIPESKSASGSPFVVISTAKSMTAIAGSTPPFLGKNKKPISARDIYTQEFPGKGTGVVANRAIKKGEIIKAEMPTLLLQFDMPGIDSKPGAQNGANELSREERLGIYGKAVERLDEVSKKKFMRQVGGDVVGIVDKNSFRLFVDGDEGHLGVWADVSLFNHDCRPNTHYRIQNLTHITVAVRDILPGEELTVSYIEGTIPYAERQERLESWGFKCACHACTQDLSQIAQSDARLKAITGIEEELEQLVKSGDDFPQDIGDRLVQLYVDERLDNYIAHAYTKAALLKSMIGNKKDAIKYANMAVEALEREYGPDTKDGDAMRGLAERTEEHWSWGVRMGGWAM
ncbi:SET domain containing protein [Rhypophila decipiens]